jgi:nitrogen fixation NifU-like protein
MTGLSELYQQVILDHNRHPRNFGPLDQANRHAEGHNPLCGDHIVIHVRLDADVVADVRFEGSGCAISRASASLMTAEVRGKPAAAVEQLRQRFQTMVTGDPAEPVEPGQMGKLTALAGVRAFPSRIKCATLPWHALRAALQGESPPAVTTE